MQLSATVLFRRLSAGFDRFSFFFAIARYWLRAWRSDRSSVISRCERIHADLMNNALAMMERIILIRLVAVRGLHFLSMRRAHTFNTGTCVRRTGCGRIRQNLCCALVEFCRKAFVRSPRVTFLSCCIFCFFWGRLVRLHPIGKIRMLYSWKILWSGIWEREIQAQNS